MTTQLEKKVREEFGTREGSYREQVLLMLYAKKGHPVKVSDVAKKVYGNAKEDSRMKVKATIVGLNMMIDELKLPYAPVEFEGRLEEATFALMPKAKRTAKKPSSKRENANHA